MGMDFINGIVDILNGFMALDLPSQILTLALACILIIGPAWYIRESRKRIAEIKKAGEREKEAAQKRLMELETFKAKVEAEKRDDELESQRMSVWGKMADSLSDSAKIQQRITERLDSMDEFLSGSAARHNATFKRIDDHDAAVRVDLVNIAAAQGVTHANQAGIVTRLERIEANQTALETIAREITRDAEPNTLRADLSKVLLVATDMSRTATELARDVRKMLEARHASDSAEPRADAPDNGPQTSDDITPAAEAGRGDQPVKDNSADIAQEKPNG